ncbi:hypothetical protein AX15_004639 [Amanita polypyramis BW_CC]|nr:hypothetical protein AX15_004639 [Amanita polypyramis BW_CC]
MVTSFEHVLLYVPDVPKKYGGTGPDPPPSLHIVPLCTPEAPAPPAPTAPPPAPWPHPQVALLSWAPPAPLTHTAPSFAEVAATPSLPSTIPKLVCLCKVCTKQGTKATTTLLWPSTVGSPSNAFATLDFVASKPLGKCLPISHAVTLCGDWSLTFTEPLTLPDLQQLQATVDQFHHPGSEVINHPTSASIKFPHMPTVWSDGSAVSDMDLLDALHSHPHWQDISFSTVRCMTPTPCPQPTPSSSLLSTFSGLTAMPKPGSSTGPPPSAPPAAGGVTQPTSAGLASCGAPLALDLTSPCYIWSQL